MSTQSKIVQFPDGSEEPRAMVDSYYDRLLTMAVYYPKFLRELLKKCRDDSYELSEEDERLRVEYRITVLDGAGAIHPSLKKIILALAIETGGTVTISNPFLD